jgi:hypothetical protein
MAGYLAEYQRHSREEAFRLPDEGSMGVSDHVVARSGWRLYTHVDSVPLTEHPLRNRRLS